MSSSTRFRDPDVRACALAAFLLVAVAPLSPAVAQPAAANPAAAMNSATYITRYVSDGRLAGEGRLTWLGFHVYDARLYAAADFDVANPFARPFVLELTYARKLDGSGIADASRDEIERLGFGTEAQRGAWHKQMTALFPDVDKGRRIAGVYQPDSGARFYVDGSYAGAIDEPEFARAFFSIWLDPRTRAPRLRESLLKGTGPSAGVANR